MTVIRSDVVGSLLRPEPLKEARRRWEAGELSGAGFKRIEDRAVDDAIRLQEDAGLDVVTDGELRRYAFFGHLIDALDGFDKFGGWAIPFHDDHGGELVFKRPVVVEKLSARHSMCAEEWVYLRARATRPGKVTLISCQQAAAYYDPDKSAGAYPTRDAYLADVVDLTRREVDELVAPRLHVHPDRRAPVRGAPRPRAARGLPAAGQRSRPAHRRVHRDGQCGDRRRTRASPSASTSAAATTSRCSTRAAATSRSRECSGAAASSASCSNTTTSAPAASSPSSRCRTIAWWCSDFVTTKKPRLEPVDELRRRIEEAARFVPLERLALSPQCGFASTMEGNRVTLDDQREKLRRVAETAAPGLGWVTAPAAGSGHRQAAVDLGSLAQAVGGARGERAGPRTARPSCPRRGRACSCGRPSRGRARLAAARWRRRRPTSGRRG